VLPYLRTVIRKALFRPVDIAPLVFFRIVFGILGMVTVGISFIGYNYVYPSYGLEQFRFKYYGFEWVEPFPQFLLVLFFVAMMVIGVLIALGKWYRILTPIFAFGLLYIFLLDKTHYLNHSYLYCWIAFLMCFLPANRDISLDVKANRTSQSKVMPAWCLYLLQFLMGVVYFFGGIAKINGDWLRGQPLKIWLDRKTTHPLFGSFIDQDWVAYFMSYGGLLLDLSAAFLLLSKKTRLPVLIAILFFHLVNMLIFEIGIFPFLSIALSLLYFSPKIFRRVFDVLQQRFAGLRRWSQESSIEPGQLWQFKYKQQIVFALLLIGLVHLLLPLRHHLFTSNVAWSEEGHRYAWRMMLRTKRPSGYLMMREKGSEKETRVKLGDYHIHPRSRSKLFTRPDMLVQAVQHIKQQEALQGRDVEIYSRFKVKLNDHPRQHLVDQKVDLTTLDWHLFSADDWIEEFVPNPEAK